MYAWSGTLGSSGREGNSAHLDRPQDAVAMYVFPCKLWDILRGTKRFTRIVNLHQPPRYHPTHDRDSIVLLAKSLFARVR